MKYSTDFYFLVLSRLLFEMRNLLSRIQNGRFVVENDYVLPGTSMGRVTYGVDLRPKHIIPANTDRKMIFGRNFSRQAAKKTHQSFATWRLCVRFDCRECLRATAIVEETFYD